MWDGLFLGWRVEERLKALTLKTQMHQGFCQALARWQDRDEEHGR